MIEGPPRFRKKVKVGGDTEAEVFCADEQSEFAVDIERWQKLAIAVLADQGVRGGTELSLFFVSVHDMAELNSEHMGKSGATDVLAFPIDGGEVLEMINGPTGASRGPDRPPPDRGDLPLLLGDIVICPEVAVAQAPSHAGSVDDEFALLVVHGILHILGWDHDTAEKTELMQAQERKLLQEHHWQGDIPMKFTQSQKVD
ncbi:MAG: rRNA maturation RNase YbeY [Actinomycetota bacterium]|nr:rRNA maturation RNase YbeY [Actinomycetota bacterium]MDA3019980.1 rRNA maturation RNase YbeY [Actinomycetota bacterium]